MDRLPALPAAISPQLSAEERERRIAEIAHVQWTTVSLAQLTQLGLSERAVRNRVAVGRLHRRHRGVYSVGHDITPWRGHVMAAVLACGEGAASSHHASGRVLGLIERGLKLHVTVVGRRPRIPGIVIHEANRLEPWQITVEQGIRCTAWPRTIVDVAAIDGRRAAERMMDRAEQLGIFDLRSLQRELGHRHGRGGAGIVRALLGQSSTTLTRSEAEELLLAICDGAGLPRPRVNALADLGDGGPPIEADFAWPDRLLMVETDGWATHGTRRAFAHDRRRDRRIAVSRWRVLRFTWHELQREPDRVARELARAMAPAS
jgi:hypothetical protein